MPHSDDEDEIVERLVNSGLHRQAELMRRLGGSLNQQERAFADALCRKIVSLAVTEYHEAAERDATVGLSAMTSAIALALTLLHSPEE